MNTVKVNIDLSFKQLVDDVLWDESMKIPAEHQALVVGRIKKAKNNPDRLMDWDKASTLLK